MSINFIPNDPMAGSKSPAMRVKSKRPNRPASRAGFTFFNTSPEKVYAPGTAGFVYWQCREAGLAALEAWESATGPFARWQGNRKKLELLQDDGVDVNAYYDRSSFAFFHRQIGTKVCFSGASTDVVAHEIGHGLLDAIRPDLWSAPYLEVAAFHEAFGDCVAVLTALHDLETRKKLLAMTSTLRKKSFVETTAEELSAAIGGLVPGHNAAEPRHAYNTFQYQIPATLPLQGGPGELINEAHSFGMLFSGCFYDLIVKLFAAQGTHTPATLLTAAKTAGALLVAGTRTAIVSPRFLQAVGQATVLEDETQNGGAHRDVIRDAFAAHDIMLGANALLAPAAVLAGGAPAKKGAPKIGAATRRDLRARLGTGAGGRMTVDVADISGRRMTRVVHTQDVALGRVDKRLKGVTIEAPVSVMLGASGGKAAVMGNIPGQVATTDAVAEFVKSLLDHGQIASVPPAKTATAAAFAGAVAGTKLGKAGKADAKAKKGTTGSPAIVTHRIVKRGGRKVLERVRFQCR